VNRTIPGASPPTAPSAWPSPRPPQPTSPDESAATGASKPSALLQHPRHGSTSAAPTPLRLSV